MMLALNEISSMAQKAARGAGIPLGQAEDLGEVAAYLAGTSGDISPVTQALTEVSATPATEWSKAQITVTSGSAALIGPVIRDAFAMGCDTATLAELGHAPLVAAFLAQNGVALTWNALHLARSDTTVLQPVCRPVAVPVDDWQIWQDFAAKTYVPQSEASRLAGAGAGLNDND